MQPRRKVLSILVIGCLWVAMAGGDAATARPHEDSADLAQRLRQATDLHDQGRYDESIALLGTLLESHPDEPTVLCELANSCMAAGRYDDAIRYAQRGIQSKKRAPDPSFCHVVLGSSWDMKGDLGHGEEVFRKALAAGIDAPGLRFNFGINLAQQHRSADAIPQFQEAIRQRPGYASAWRALAVTWQGAGEGTRAFLAFARFLTLEPAGPRSAAAVKQMQALLFTGVTNRGPDPKTGKERIDVTIPSSDSKGPTKSATLALMMAMVAATRHTEEWKDKSDAAFFAHGFEQVASILEELGAKDESEDPFWRETVLPYFRAARGAGHLEAMAWDILRSTEDSEVTRWIAEHQEPIDGYRAWSAQWNAPVPKV